MSTCTVAEARSEYSSVRIWLAVIVLGIATFVYLREEAQVVYQSKDGKHEKVFDALEWLAAMSSHVPE
ncbi:MAG: hypothetical protein ACREV4_10150 [Gammaproteobacteria bacterium]